jgi:hypothetical protein
LDRGTAQVLVSPRWKRDRPRRRARRTVRVRMYVYPYPFLRLRLPRAHCSSALIIRNEATPAHSNAAFGAASRRGRSQAPRLRRRSSRGSAERKHRNTALHKRWRSRPGIPPFRGLGRTDPWMTPLWSRSAKDFRPRVKQMLTRAAVACLIEPNARKAYPLALSRVRPATIRGPHLPIGRRRLIDTHKGAWWPGADERN